MTRTQKKWLGQLQRDGFVEMGGWGNGQKNRPLWALVERGLAEFDWGPKGSFLKTQGFVPTNTAAGRKPASNGA